MNGRFGMGGMVPLTPRGHGRIETQMWAPVSHTARGFAIPWPSRQRAAQAPDTHDDHTCTGSASGKAYCLYNTT